MPGFFNSPTWPTSSKRSPTDHRRGAAEHPFVNRFNFRVFFFLFHFFVFVIISIQTFICRGVVRRVRRRRHVDTLARALERFMSAAVHTRGWTPQRRSDGRNVRRRHFATLCVSPAHRRHRVR